MGDCLVAYRLWMHRRVRCKSATDEKLPLQLALAYANLRGMFDDAQQVTLIRQASCCPCSDERAYGRVGMEAV